MKTQARPVDFSRQDDYTCALLGALGFSGRYIESETHLRRGQISYRIKKAGLRITDYRNGDSVFATLVLRSVRDRADAQLTKHLTKFL